MVKYIIKRILSGILTLFIILTLVFFMMRIVGGNPAYHMLDASEISKESIERLSHEMGFDRPLIVQYFEYIKVSCTVTGALLISTTKTFLKT